jgi:hypothetical protein
MKSNLTATDFRSTFGTERCACSQGPALIGGTATPWLSITRRGSRSGRQSLLPSVVVQTMRADRLCALHCRLNDDAASPMRSICWPSTARGRSQAAPTPAARTACKATPQAKAGIRLSEHIAADGALVFDHATSSGLKALCRCAYRSGRARTWIKVKNNKAPAFIHVQDRTF